MCVSQRQQRRSITAHLFSRQSNTTICFWWLRSSGENGLSCRTMNLCETSARDARNDNIPSLNWRYSYRVLIACITADTVESCISYRNVCHLMLIDARDIVISILVKLLFFILLLNQFSRQWFPWTFRYVCIRLSLYVFSLNKITAIPVYRGV